MLGWERGSRKARLIEDVAALRKTYESTIYDYSLNPALLKDFEERYSHALDSRRDMTSFLTEEQDTLNRLIEKVRQHHAQADLREEARRRHLAGKTFADKIANEYRQRIDHYPEITIHPDADTEVCKLYGAISLLDSRHWSALGSFLRRALPQRGHLDRINLDQRFWRLIPARENRLPTDLERYRQLLAVPSATNKEKRRESQECIKTAAFFLHDLLETCEYAKSLTEGNEEVEAGLTFINEVIKDFRLTELRKRR